MVWSESKGEMLCAWRWETGKVTEHVAWNPGLNAESHWGAVPRGRIGYEVT